MQKFLSIERKEMQFVSVMTALLLLEERIEAHNNLAVPTKAGKKV